MGALASSQTRGTLSPGTGYDCSLSDSQTLCRWGLGSGQTSPQGGICAPHIQEPQPCTAVSCTGWGGHPGTNARCGWDGGAKPSHC